jgi:D-glycero-D-manno-heptose 1,7-bisphosphate phosphatase
LAGNFENRPALFLDRDGVIVADTHYLGRAEDIGIMRGAAEAIARCNRFGIPVVLARNQSGIARGLYDWEGFCAVQTARAAALANAGAHLDAVLACAHHADGNAPHNIANHPRRKPNPGMIVAAGELMKLNLARSWIVGDRASDIESGRAAHLQGGILLSQRQDDPERDVVARKTTEHFAAEISGLAGGCGWVLARKRMPARWILRPIGELSVGRRVGRALPQCDLLMVD